MPLKMEFDLITDDFAHQVRRANQAVNAAWNRVSKDLTTTQYAILQVVVKHGPLDQKTLGAMAAVDRSTLTPLIDRMAARGLITRQSDSNDRRRTLVSATASGRRRARLGHVQAQEAARWIRDAVGDTPLKTLSRQLEMIVEHAPPSPPADA